MLEQKMFEQRAAGTLFRLILTAALLALGTGCTDHLQEGTKAYQAHNYNIALKELMPLADKGDAQAQVLIGFMYDNGEGVPQDYRQAIVWYRKAAEQGNASAQYNLGMLYANGLGVQQDWEQAYFWMILAALEGHGKAMETAKAVETRIAPAQIEKGAAMANEWRKKHRK